MLHPGEAPVIIHRKLPLNNIGPIIVSDWRDKSSLLAMTLELQAYIERGDNVVYYDAILHIVMHYDVTNSRRHTVRTMQN